MMSPELGENYKAAHDALASLVSFLFRHRDLSITDFERPEHRAEKEELESLLDRASERQDLLDLEMGPPLHWFD